MPQFAPLDCRYTAESPHAARRVLYVEDHPVNVLLMQGLLAQRPSVRLRVAASGEEALNLVLDEPPQLLLLDLHLPDCRGAELLERLRALPGMQRVPAVAVTADDDAALDGTSFLEAWHKPLDLYATLRRLDALLEVGRAAEREDGLPPRSDEGRQERMRGLY